jgi:L-lactate dehydrogenase complex protein LldG
MNTTGSKDRILARIREALCTPAPHSHTPHSSTEGQESTSTREWLPAVPLDSDGRRKLFENNSAPLKTTVVRCATTEEASRAMSSIAASEGWKKMAYHQHPLTQVTTTPLPAGIQRICVDEGYDVDAMEACDAGITTCEALVAQTGSILISAADCGGRALSVLPPHHVVIATADQIVGDLTDAFARLRSNHPGGLPSYFSFITGPSRTGDIERILVLGAHGPKKLTVLLVDSA